MSGPGLHLDVLLVDHDPVVRKSYGAELRGEGWSVTVAADGNEALDAASAQTFDVVLLDLRIPSRTGPEVLRAIRARPKSKATEVFLLAQSGDADLVDLAMGEGAQGVFEKSRTTPRDVVNEISGRFAARAESARGAPEAPADGLLARARREATVVAPGAKPGASCAPTVADETPASAKRHTPAQFAKPAHDAPRAAPPADAVVVDDVPVFSTMLSRYVGESAQLAAALGLPGDLACGACRTQLALRLSPDPAVPSGVRGRFYCPHCDRS